MSEQNQSPLYIVIKFFLIAAAASIAAYVCAALAAQGR